MAAVNLTLREAWQHWGTFSNAADVFLWGHSIQWWGRVGVILQVVSGLGVILDIIGEKGFSTLWKHVSSPIKSDDIGVAMERAQSLGCTLWLVGVGVPLGYFIVIAFQRLPILEAFKGTILLLIPFCLFGYWFTGLFLLYGSDIFYKSRRRSSRTRRYFSLHRGLRFMFFCLFVIGSHFAILAL